MQSNETSGQTCPLIKKRWVGKGDYLTPIFWKLSKRERFLFGRRTERERETESKEIQQCATLEKHAKALYKDIPEFQS